MIQKNRSYDILAAIFTLGFVAACVLLVLVVFIKPVFLEPVTSWINNFGRFTLGSIEFSVGGTLAIILFFGLTGAGYREMMKRRT